MHRISGVRRCVACGIALMTMAAAQATLAAAAEPTFRRHDINPESAFCACAAVDVNRDGRLDIVCGGWWYEAPGWTRRLVREVPIIRGRYDDYSSLPLDVNGDGWTDLVSANYRSETLFWIEHPGPSLGPWKAHVIEKPGPMETARLADVNGDGRPDVLPNGARFAAWWELDPGRPAPGGAPRWVRHDLPSEAAGHGLGFGDVNGDGRGDIVTPRGWLEAAGSATATAAPEWQWRAEFELHRDASIPILVHDVDGDGDSDLVWGRGHRMGVYWMEQAKGPDGARKWIRHAVDTSWSQAHSPLLADLDKDGRPEIVVGKRYLGHEGRDLGEYDPLVVCWYKFDPQQRTFRRGVIASGGPVGMGLDPKAADLDADGDVDLILPGRSGLYWMENLLVQRDKAETQCAADAATCAALADHTKLMVYQDAAGVEQPVATAAQWALRRAAILRGMEAAMGELPDPSRRVPLDVQSLEEQPTEDYVRIRLSYAAEPGDRVPAYLLVPQKLQGKAPAMLCLHQTTGIGKKEPAGMGGLPNLHYAHELARLGFVCLVPDYPSFGDYPYDFRKPGYASGSMKAIWNNLRAVDLLESLPQVDADRIGCIGHSLGGHNTLFTAALDQRIRAVVTSCGFTGFADYYGGKLKGWTSDRYMPRIREIYACDPRRVPFDFHEVLAAIAPRGVFVNAPVRDSNFDVSGVKKVMAAAGEVYQLLGAAGRLRAEYPECGHDFPEPVRHEAYQWLRQMLK